MVDADNSPAGAPTSLPYIWMLCGATSFAAMGGFAHALGGDVDWRIVALVRSALAVIFSAGAAWYAGAQLTVWGSRSLWLRSLAGSGSMLCNFYALTHLPVSSSLTLTNTFPIWIAILSWPMLGAPPRRDAWIAIAIGLAGVLLLQLSMEESEPRPLAHSDLLASLAALGGGFFTALAMIGLHRLKAVAPETIVAHFSGVALLVCGAAVMIGPLDNSAPSLVAPRLLTFFLGLGISGTVGQFLLTKALASGPPAKVSVVALSQVGFGAVLDIVIWQREFTLMGLSGMLLVVAPTAWLIVRREVRAAMNRA
ncbi:MAG: DMT family transporter [Pirellulales bacterium]